MSTMVVRWPPVRAVSRTCLGVMSLLSASFLVAQIGPDPSKQREATAGSASETAESRGTSEKLARKYDLNRVGNRGVGSGFNVYSMEREWKLGRKLSARIDQSVRTSEEPITTKYLNRLCQTLSRQSDSPFPLTVRIINGDEANIFALPGGFLYVTTGVFGAVNNEAELAGLISHEIAHIAARHATRHGARRTLWKVVSTPAMFLPFGGLAIQIGDVALPMKLSRDAELEADLLGLEYMYLSGYDPNEFLRFLDRAYVLVDSKPSRMALVFSGYPSLEERLRRDQVVISTFPAREEYAVDTSTFAEVKAKYGPSEPELRHAGKNSSGPRLRRHMH